MFYPRARIISTTLVMLLLLLAGMPRIAAAQDEEITLRVWDQFTGPETESVDAIYEAFEEQHPNITIEREAVQTDQMRQTVKTALASGTGPDIVFYDAGPGYAGVLADAGLIMPLEEAAAEYGWRDRIAEAALQGATIDDQLYGLPLQVDLIGMYVNKTLMEQEGFEVPETMGELVEFCQEASAAGYIPLAFSNNPGWQAFHPFSMVANDIIGPEAMEQLLFENEGRWDTPEIVSAIESFFVELQEAGCFPPSVNALTYDDTNALFFSGQALMIPTGSWLVNDIEQNMADFEVEMVPFPEPEGAQGRYWTTGVGSAYFISEATENPDAAAMFLDYLFSPETAQRWVEEARFVVPVEFDTEAVEGTPLFKSILDVLATAASEQTELGYNIDVLTPPQFNEVMLNGFQAILAGDKTAEEQAADLQAAWEEGWTETETE